ncbi:MAG: OmpA family protein, partial [Bacteroidota bacterium]
QYTKAIKIYERMVFLQETKEGDWESYRLFIDKNPSNSLIEVARDSIYNICKNSKNTDALQYCLNTFSGDKKNEVLLMIHDIYTDDGETSTLNLFYEKYDYDFFDEIKIVDYDLAEEGDNIDLTKSYDESDYYEYDSYIRKAAPKERAFVMLQHLISEEIKNKRWKNAINIVESYQSYFGLNNKKIAQLLSILNAKLDASIKIQAFGPEINSDNGREYTPVISADNKYIYFCGINRHDNIGGEDIFQARLKSSQQANVISDLSTPYSHDSPLSISTDGTSFIIFRNGKLLTSEKLIKGWSEPIEISGDLNSGIWQADAMVSSDRNALIFTSIREGNYDHHINVEPGYYHGESEYASDIYVCLKNKDGEWGDAINLGPTINTPYGDRSPFLHPDMKTLYFSSSGHGGLGGLDVFKSTRLSDTCWTCWSEPVNLGKEINTPGSDWGYKISTNGETAYFSKNTNGYSTEDLYSFNLPPHLRPDFVARIEGKIKNSENKPISTIIHWEDLESNKVIGTSKTDPVDGSYFIVLPMGKNYGYFIEDSSYFPISQNLDLRKEKNAVEVSKDIVGITFNDMIEKSIAVPMNNLFFDYNKYNLLPSSKPELVRLASIIKKYNLKIEIAGHTDDVGDDKSNVTLSEKRANAVREFLIGQGCSSSLLQTVGYGESRPIVDNDTDENRAKNRRVELRFIK